jgi:hypothetical protein
MITLNGDHTKQLSLYLYTLYFGPTPEKRPLFGGPDGGHSVVVLTTDV